MTGLEKIIESIKSEAALSAERILSEADTKCAEITASAKEKADKLQLEMSEDAKKQYDMQIQRAKSYAEFIKNQNLLIRKRELIDEFLKEAEKRFIALPEKEYFSCMQRLIDENTRGGASVIFNSRDKMRMPDGFDLKGNKLSEIDGSFDGGFIMDFGDVEINCTVSALFEDAYDRLSDTVNSILFGGV